MAESKTEKETEKKELICIGCPLGCGITVEMETGPGRSAAPRIITGITGYTCKRGEEYARKEVLNPTRIVTSTVRITSGREKMLPVKTREDIPKDKIFEVMRELDSVLAAAPVHIGDTVLENAAQTGVPVVATKEVPE